MIKHTQNIMVNCNQQKAWSFLIDFSRSLIFDRFFLVVELPSKYSINEDHIFNIKARYLFNDYSFSGSVIDNVPPYKLILKFVDRTNSNIILRKSFQISAKNDEINLFYTYIANFDNIFRNILLYSALKASCISELFYIKKAIESSEKYNGERKVKTILH